MNCPRETFVVVLAPVDRYDSVTGPAGTRVILVNFRARSESVRLISLPLQPDNAGAAGDAGSAAHIARGTRINPTTCRQTSFLLMTAPFLRLSLLDHSLLERPGYCYGSARRRRWRVDVAGELGTSGSLRNPSEDLRP